MVGYEDIIKELDTCVNRLAAENEKLRALLAEVVELEGALPEFDAIVDLFKRIDEVLDYGK